MAGYKDDGGENKKKFAILAVSSILLVAMVAAVAVEVTNGGGIHKKEGGGGGQISASQKNVEMLCQPTRYNETCKKSLEKASTETTDVKELIKVVFNATAEELSKHINNTELYKKLVKDDLTKQALQICDEVLDMGIDNIYNSLEKFDEFELTKLNDFAYDLKVWLGGILTQINTCLDGFDNTTTDAGKTMTKVLEISKQLTTNALDIISSLSDSFKSFYANKKPSSRKLLPEDGLPSWLSEGKRRLLQAPGLNGMKPDAVVAQDGSGQYKTITEALSKVPPKNAKPFVIYIKAGIYKEMVSVTKQMSFVTLIGDGPTETRITGNLGEKDGYQTYFTATVGVNGANFMAKNIGFENAAGAEKHQAVALRITADKAIIYNCNMDGYQDTVYANSMRQFYRDCTITGTIDFVFGDADGVFQNCKLIMRKPLDNQYNVVMASGKADPKTPSALVFQNCHFSADQEYVQWVATKQKPNSEGVARRAFLGRPWKQYAKTVVMDSQIDDLFYPEGYEDWMGNLYHESCSFLEYNNKGTGADTTGRVKWPGVKTITQQEAIAKYYPNAFYEIKNADEKDSWIVASGVPYSPGSM